MKFITISIYLKYSRVGYTADKTEHEEIVCGINTCCPKKIDQLVQCFLTFLDFRTPSAFKINSRTPW